MTKETGLSEHQYTATRLGSSTFQKTIILSHLCENFKCIPLILNKRLAIPGFHLLSDRTYKAACICITQILTANTNESNKHVIYTTKVPTSDGNNMIPLTTKLAEMFQPFCNGYHLVRSNSLSQLLTKTKGQWVPPMPIYLAYCRCVAFQLHAVMAPEDYTGPQTSSSFNILKPTIVQGTGVTTVNL